MHSLTQLWPTDKYAFMSRIGAHESVKLFGASAVVPADRRPVTVWYALTLIQWSSSGNPVATQCAWNLDPNVHLNATGERIVGSQCASSGLSVVFQWLSSGLLVCSNYAN